MSNKTFQNSSNQINLTSVQQIELLIQFMRSLPMSKDTREAARNDTGSKRGLFHAKEEVIFLREYMCVNLFLVAHFCKRHLARNLSTGDDFIQWFLNRFYDECITLINRGIEAQPCAGKRTIERQEWGVFVSQRFEMYNYAVGSQFPDLNSINRLANAYLLNVHGCVVPDNAERSQALAILFCSLNQDLLKTFMQYEQH